MKRPQIWCEKYQYWCSTIIADHVAVIIVDPQVIIVDSDHVFCGNHMCFLFVVCEFLPMGRLFHSFSPETRLSTLAGAVNFQRYRWYCWIHQSILLDVRMFATSSCLETLIAVSALKMNAKINPKGESHKQRMQHIYCLAWTFDLCRP